MQKLIKDERTFRRCMILTKKRFAPFIASKYSENWNRRALLRFMFSPNTGKRSKGTSQNGLQDAMVSAIRNVSTNLPH